MLRGCSAGTRGAPGVLRSAPRICTAAPQVLGVLRECSVGAPGCSSDLHRCSVGAPQGCTGPAQALPPRCHVSPRTAGAPGPCSRAEPTRSHITGRARSPHPGPPPSLNPVTSAPPPAGSWAAAHTPLGNPAVSPRVLTLVPWAPGLGGQRALGPTYKRRQLPAPLMSLRTATASLR